MERVPNVNQKWPTKLKALRFQFFYGIFYEWIQKKTRG